MKTFVRWTAFTAAVTAIWLVGGFCYLFLSRHYEQLQLPAAMLGAMFLMSALSALAAISHAQKLEETDAEEAARAARLRVRPQR